MLSGPLRRHIVPAVLTVLFCAAPSVAAASTGELWVAPGGSDIAAGTESAPLATVGKAIALATTGQTVKVMPGSYPAVKDTKVHANPVTVEAAEATPPTIAGFELYGAQHLTLAGLRITGQVYFGPHQILGAQKQPASDITVRDSEITTNQVGGYCVVIRAGQGVSLIDNHLHDCRSGIVTPPNIAVSRDITVRGNLMEDFYGDGMLFAGWEGALIEGNIIRHIDDPENKTHNDGLQMVGDNTYIEIIGNQISDSADQLMLIQDQSGVNAHLTFENNVLHGCGAYGIQIFGTTDTRFVNNTVWDCKWSSLLVRRGQFGPPDVTVVNNVLASIQTYEAVIPVRHHNVTRSDRGIPAEDGDIVGVDPLFIDAEGGDFRLLPKSPALGAADTTLAPAIDLLGAERPEAPASGAYELVTAGDPGTGPQPEAPADPSAPIVPGGDSAPAPTTTETSADRPRLVTTVRRVRTAGLKRVYRIVVRNAGNADASRVRVLVRLPRRMVHVSGGRRAGSIVTFRTTSLDVGKTATFRLVVRLKRGTAGRHIRATSTARR